MSKQTAVQLLKDVLNAAYLDEKNKEYTNILFNHALKMEREQIVEAFKIGSDKGYDCALDYITHEECDEQNYYKETYGGQDEK
jgi:hypothetical protein